MRFARVLAVLPWALWLAGCCGGAALAAFVPVDDFESLSLGPIDGQPGWTAAESTSAVVPDPDGWPNQVLEVATESTHLCREIFLADGVTRVLFFRFRYTEQVNLSFGLSELVHPFRADHFDAELSLDNAPASLRVNDGGIYRALTTLQPDLWYNCWMLVDNTTNVIRLWLHPRGSDAASPADLLTVDGLTEFSFRYESAEDLHTFFLKTGGGSGLPGAFYVDDIYLEDSSDENLSNPAATAMRVPDDGVLAEDALIRVYPSPATGPVCIDLSPRFHGVEAIRICDVGGREVNRLTVVPASNGGGRSTWDGRDRHGRLAEAGVYYVTPVAGRSRAPGSLIILR